MILKVGSFDTGVVTLKYAEGPPTGPPLVLLHGGSARWQEFEPLIPTLAARWHVYAPDFRGHGESGRVPSRYRLRDYVADIGVFLEGRVGQPAVLFGHSLGGQVALMLAAQRPELARAVVNGDAPLALERLREHIARHRPLTEAWRDLAGSGRPVAEVAAALRGLRLPVPGHEAPRLADVLGADSPWFEAMAENLRRLDPDQLTAVIDDFDATHAGYDWELLLPAITCPVLLLQADPAQGGLLADEEVARATALNPRISHVRVEGVGHGLHMQQAELVLAALTDFLTWSRNDLAWH